MPIKDPDKRREYEKNRNATPARKADRKARRRTERQNHNPKIIAKDRAHHKLWRSRNPAKRAGRPRPAVCDICGGSKGGIEFDHCHTHGHFRGWICKHCNGMLGFARDDPVILIKAAAYLLRTTLNDPPQLSLPGV
jgi:hypothetical protein